MTYYCKMQLMATHVLLFIEKPGFFHFSEFSFFIPFSLSISGDGTTFLYSAVLLVEDGPNRYASPPDGDFPANPFSRLVIGVFIVVGASMLLINVFLIACFLKRRSKKRMTSGEKKIN